MKDKQTFIFYTSDKNIIASVPKASVDSMVLHDYDSYPALDVTKCTNMRAVYDLNTQRYMLMCTGTNSSIRTVPLSSDLPEDSCVIEFQYKSHTGVSNGGKIMFGNTVDDSRTITIDPLKKSSVWQTVAYRIKTPRHEYSWGSKGQWLRLDIGGAKGESAVIRALRIRSLNADEAKLQASEDNILSQKEYMPAHLEAYLAADMPDSITNVTVTGDSVTISGELGSDDSSCRLVDLPPYADVTETKKFGNGYAITAQDGKFAVTLPRRVEQAESDDSITYDRALSRWAIVKDLGSDSDAVTSHARYADTVYAKVQAPLMPLKSKKGVAGGSDVDMFFADFDSLGVGSTTMNVVLNWLMSLTYSSNAIEYTYGGVKYYINKTALASYDRFVGEAYKRGIVLSAILLVNRGSLSDPECNGGNYAMPDMTTPRAVNNYAAVLEFLASRYSGSEHGRINHWIMHNEVDMGSTWTNMGNQPVGRYLDRYVKSMRMCYNIARQYDQNASVLASFTHSWTAATSDGDGYAPKSMLERIVKYSAAEDDFRWGVAYHPYAYDLTKPQFWSDDSNVATYDMNTSYVTFRNPEVISNWILQPSHLYKSNTKRILFFSEQGLNTRSYSDSEFKLQAAGTALIWKKIQALPGIDAMQWHNWKDNTAEGGLRLGMRTFDDTSAGYKDYDKKPSWYVWQAARTDNEDSVFQPYLNVIGISSWDNIVQDVK